MSLTRMQQRRGTSLQWTNVGSSVVLAAGELGFESDTGKFKIGDGINYWNTLPYFQTETQNTAEYVKLATSQTITGTQTFIPASLSGKALIVKGFSGQTANLQEWQNSAGAVLSYVDSAGNTNFSGSGSWVQSSTGKAAFITNTATAIPLTVKGAVSQSSALQQWQDSTGNPLAQVSATGAIITSTTVTTIGIRDGAGTGSYIDLTATSVTLRTRNATNPGLVINGSSSQTANLQEWQNSSSVVLTRIGPTGVPYVGPVGIANATRFPNAQMVISNTTVGAQSEAVHNIGLISEATSGAAGVYGVGVYGKAYTSSTTQSRGVVGESHAGTSTDAQSAIGVIGYSGDVHPGANIGVFGQASGSTLIQYGSQTANWAFYNQSGDFFSLAAHKWVLANNAASSLSFDTSGKLGILNINSTTGSEGISTSGTFSASGTVTLPTGTTKIGTSSLAQGAAFTYTLPSTSANATLLAAPAAITAGGVLYASTAANSASTAAGTQNQVITSNAASAPTWQTLDLTYLPDAAYKKSVAAGTTTDLGASLATASTLTGYSLTSTTNTTTTAASTTLTVVSSAGIKAGAVVSTATTALAAGTTVATIASGTSITVSNRAAITTTSIIPTAGTAVATFATQTYAPYAVGSTIAITGTTPATYTGSFVVTACTTTSVSWTTAETVTASVQGTINFTIAAGTTLSTIFTNTISALSMDGVTPVLNGRILVKNQTTVGGLAVTANRDNGIYYVSTLGTTSVPWVLTRVNDGSTTSQMAGATVNVDAGTTLGGQLWSNSMKTTDTLSTTAMVWNRLINNGDTIPVAQGGTGATTATGTAGSVVLSTSPTLSGPKYSSNTYTTTTTLTLTNDFVFVTAAAAWTLTLPAPTAGKMLHISRSDAAAFILSVLGHINGVAATTNTTWFPSTTANRRVILISDGTTWFPMSVGTVV